MDQFSISQLARFSGIKAHTIRIWEQRYNALKPDRTEGNTRLYNGSQLRRLLNIVSLSEKGHRISTLCGLPDKKLSVLVAAELVKKNAEPKNEFFISQVISAGITYNESLFEETFSACVGSMGMREAYLQVIYPVLERIGILWASENIIPASEHFLSNLIRQKIFSAIDSLPAAKENSRWLLLLPPGEYHELGLLMANYLLRQAGYPVIYLGPDVPNQSVHDVLAVSKPSNILGFIVHRDDEGFTSNWMQEMSSIFRGNIYIACSPGQEVTRRSKRLHFIHTLRELEALFR